MSWQLKLVLAVVGGGVGFFGPVLVPLLRFEPFKCTLTTNQQGMTSIINGHTRTITWAEIESLFPERKYTVLSDKEGQVVLLPPQAFRCREHRQQFLDETSRLSAESMVASAEYRGAKSRR